MWDSSGSVVVVPAVTTLVGESTVLALSGNGGCKVEQEVMMLLQMSLPFAAARPLYLDDTTGISCEGQSGLVEEQLDAALLSPLAMVVKWAPWSISPRKKAVEGSVSSSLSFSRLWFLPGGNGKGWMPSTGCGGFIE